MVGFIFFFRKDTFLVFSARARKRGKVPSYRQVSGNRRRTSKKV